MAAAPVDASHREVGRSQATSAVKLVNADAFAALDVPWPRCQSMPKALFSRDPTSADLLLAVSHGWPYQVHLDPLGHKVAPVQQLLQRAIEHHRPLGRLLVFWTTCPSRSCRAPATRRRSSSRRSRACHGCTSKPTPSSTSTCSLSPTPRTASPSPCQPRC